MSDARTDPHGEGAAADHAAETARDVPRALYAVGDAGRPVTYRVTRERIRAFVEAIGEDNPIYRDAALARTYGHNDTPVPPTFLACLAAFLPRARDGLEAGFCLHVEQRFVYHQMVRAGDLLRARSRVEGVGPAVDGERVTVSTTIENDAGEVVCTASSAYVVRR